ncbi:hypothetical protein QT381_13570 [Galbitalea sp. SE-J8]|uniref:hypothetical protein n=1 Tax=Galbitalea sp. SE-J8 TaxID=3054952 RepID=UPI00259CEB58|nr:hypothetical protein [Galbitalea sp. SE-J8]MDM4764039.1 hypothetical protein [Galbitalea sp. SE-J8]
MNRPRFAAIDDGMLRRLRVLFAFVGVVWTAFGVVRIVYATSLGGPVLTAIVLVIGLGFVTASVLAHVELRARGSETQE